MTISAAMHSPAADVVIPRLPPERTGPAKPKPKLSLRTVAPLLIGALIGAVIGFVGIKFGTHFFLPGLPKWIGLLNVALLPLAWLLCVAFHELGHLVGGWISGGRFLLYVVGPFMWKRTPSGVNFSWNTNINIFGGLAACLPLEASRATTRGTAVMVAGGPVFSLVLLVAAAWSSATLAPHATTAPMVFAQHFTMFVAGLSGLTFLVTAMPGTGGGFKTDGLRCYELLRGDAQSEQESAVITLTTLSLGGVRPADYDARLVEKSISLRDGSLFDLYAHLTAAHHYIDAGQPGRGQALLDHALASEDQLVGFARDTARCDYAWILATYTTDAAAARAWVDSAGPLAIDPATRLRAEAAVLLAEGKKPEAAAKAREGLHAAEHKSLSPMRNSYTFDTLQDILRRAESATEQATPGPRPAGRDGD
jgi:hypothetical protein